MSWGLGKNSLYSAKKVDNYAIDATGGGLWTTTTTYKIVCPTGKRWVLIGGVINRGVSATVNVIVYNASDEPIQFLYYAAASTGTSGYPSSTNAGNGVPILDVGEYVLATFGAAQNAASYMTCLVLEVPYPQ